MAAGANPHCCSDVQDADGAKKAEGDSQPSTEAETEAGSQEEEEDELDMSQIDVVSWFSCLFMLHLFYALNELIW